MLNSRVRLLLCSQSKGGAPSDAIEGFFQSAPINGIAAMALRELDKRNYKLFAQSCIVAWVVWPFD